MLKIFASKLEIKCKDEEYLDLINKSMKENVMSIELFVENFSKRFNLSEKENEILHTYINKYITTIEKKDISSELALLAKLKMNSKNNARVGSLTTKNNNVKLWNLYANNGSGYCIEYDVPKSNEFLSLFFPVIYREERPNKIFLNIFIFFAEVIANFEDIFINHTVNENTKIHYVFENLCSKELEWEYQDEWRIISLEKDRTKYNLKILNIYLGWDCSKENEDIILSLSNKHGFNVYKAVKEENSEIISFNKL